MDSTPKLWGIFVGGLQLRNILENGLVSIIIPCYNGAPYITRMLNSICLQTYRRIQLIFVNDGSQDETENIFNSYKIEFTRIGIRYIYLYQENQGQAEAINKALLYIRGEYLMWLDADDYISTDHIERKVNCLKKAKNCDIVRCRGIIIDEMDNYSIKGYLGKEHAVGTLFEDLLFELRECSNGLYMVRTEEFFKALQNQKLYSSKAGQNYQLLLPITYLYRVYYIKDILFHYIERRESHSHNFGSINDWGKRLDEIYDVKLHVLDEMKHMISDEYLNFIESQLNLLQLFQRVNRIIDFNYEVTDNVYIRETMLKLEKYMKQRNKIWIWGSCKKNKRLAMYLNKYLSINIGGFIDSDVKKQKYKDTIKPEEIDASQMYIIILLEYHPDIIATLYSRGFIDNKNFIYPKYELIKNIKNKNKLKKNCEI